MSTLEDMQEYCNECGVTLEVGQIGCCGDCQAEREASTVVPAASFGSYVGAAALQNFFYFLNSASQDDATGSIYGMLRNPETRDLELKELLANEVEVLSDLNPAEWPYEMVVIDSGNSHGDAWKAVMHPIQQVLTFVREDLH